jgi:hypothetical protein
MIFYNSKRSEVVLKRYTAIIRFFQVPVEYELECYGQLDKS